LLKYKIVCTMKRYNDRIYLDEYLYGTWCKHTEMSKFDDLTQPPTNIELSRDCLRV
jgi:hypothetical protein